VRVFNSREQAVSLFSELFSILLSSDEFTSRMADGKLNLHLIQHNPDFQLFIEPGKLYIDEVPSRPVITIKMSSDTAHALWSGRLLMPLALATGKVRIKGSMAKVLEFVPLLQPAFDRYPALAADAGITS
jgi:putative sterol carrier protein